MKKIKEMLKMTRKIRVQHTDLQIWVLNLYSQESQEQLKMNLYLVKGLLNTRTKRVRVRTFTNLKVSYHLEEIIESHLSLRK